MRVARRLLSGVLLTGQVLLERFGEELGVVTAVALWASAIWLGTGEIG